MRSLVTKIVKHFLALILLVPFFIFNTPVLAQNDGFNFKEDSGLDKTADVGGFVTGTDAASVDSLIGIVITVVLGLIGVVFLVFMIYGGFVWMTADGNEDKIKSAKNTLINSIYGLVIVLSAYVISNFLINYFA